MKISTKTQYGLRAMVYLAKNKGLSSIKEISEKEGIPFDYLEKILTKLKGAGFIMAKKGSGGGYFLRKPASEIKIGGIVKTLEGNYYLISCVSKSKRFVCPREKTCMVKPFWGKVQKALDRAFNSITLADLAKLR